VMQACAPWLRLAARFLTPRRFELACSGDGLAGMSRNGSFGELAAQVAM
jgi:hypothetical protein